MKGSLHLDFSETFGTASHQIPCTKLIQIVLDGSVVAWAENWLALRAQQGGGQAPRPAWWEGRTLAPVRARGASLSSSPLTTTTTNIK